MIGQIIILYAQETEDMKTKHSSPKHFLHRFVFLVDMIICDVCLFRISMIIFTYIFTVSFQIWQFTNENIPQIICEKFVVARNLLNHITDVCPGQDDYHSLTFLGIVFKHPDKDAF